MGTVKGKPQIFETSIKMKTGTPSDPGIRENVLEEAISRMFIAVLFTIVKNLSTF